jgi:hypothetical protein
MSPDVPISGGGASFPPLNPGGSWNVPRVSLPGLFGIQPQFASEWWYYVGTVYDAAGKAFSLQVEILRASEDGIQIGSGITGIGWKDHGKSNFVFGLGFGFGAAESLAVLPSLLVPPVADDAFSASVVPLLEVVGQSSNLLDDLQINLPFPSGFDGWKFKYLKGESGRNPLGAAGSVYSIGAHGRGYKTTAHGTSDVTGTAKSEYRLALTVQDQRGMVMEGVSGYVGPNMISNGDTAAPASYECAQPFLKIRSGGSLVIDGQAHSIAGGYLWLDRQLIAAQPRPSSSSTAAPRDAAGLKALLIEKAQSPKSLYCGDWMGLVLENGLTMTLVEFWQPHTGNEKQWITGTKVGKPPKPGFGNLYYKTGGDPAGQNGGRPLRPRLRLDSKEWDYDVNILCPEKPEDSPHWTSPLSKHTYATAWQIDFAPHLRDHGLPETAYVYAVSDNCENLVPMTGGYFEGAALVYADKDKTQFLGHVFVEQMGFN